MKYRINFTKRADSHVKIILKSGNKADISKFSKIIEELEKHPSTGIGNPEQLKYELSGFWRGITSELVFDYEIKKLLPIHLLYQKIIKSLFLAVIYL